GGVPESVLNNKTGFLINPKSQKEIMEKILLLLKNKNLKKEFSLAALKRTSVVLSNSKSNKLIDIFKRNSSRS
ncbi:MAG TPA: glycosyltransferase, partial [Candidatus Nanoarchaeia archaeon]|nr:glycosyltransferase [Candidatus Nanoarchaeia archaeon]